MVNHLFRMVVVISLISLLTACTTVSDIAEYDDTLDSEHIPLDEQLWANRRSDQFHSELVEQGLIYKNEMITAYIQRIESKLLSDQSKIAQSIRVYVIKSPSPNAFAMPNGIVYIHSGLFTTLQSEAQLASVLSHEIAHVTERHSLKSIIDRKNTLIGAHIADFATGGLGLAYSLALADLMNYSRSQELEADIEGLQTLFQAGYEPTASLETFQTMQKHPDLKHVKNSMFSSHPTYQQRVATLEELVAKMPSQSSAKSEAGEQQFAEMKAAMMEDNIRIRLRQRQYKLAQVIIDQAADYFSEEALLSYYRGEVARGNYLHPVDAAIEDAWIETGKTKVSKDLVAKYVADTPVWLRQALHEYQTAVHHPTPYKRAYKRLGEMSKYEGNIPAAIDYYQTYLDAVPDAQDRRSVQIKLDRLK